jgi:hypothetical protein
MNEERPIEKLLRRYAKKRRDEAGPAPELHPATRRMLQSEVERQFPKPADKETSAFDEFVAMFARRWIYAVSVLVVLMVVGAVMLPTLSKSKSKIHLVKNAPASPSEAMQASAPVASVAAPTSAAVDELAFATNSIAGAVPTGLADTRRDNTSELHLGAEREFRSGGGNFVAVTDSGTALSVAPVIESATASAVPAKREVGKVLFSENLGASRNVDLAATTRPDLSIIKSKGSVADALIHDKARLARGGGAWEKDAPGYYRQSFSNDQPPAAKAVTASALAKKITPVLASFQIEQSGNKLRVIDGDGSTYHGQITPDQADGLAESGTFKNDAKEQVVGGLRAEHQKQTSGPYQFRVEGTNRTLNQQVVFTWNCVPITNALAFSNSSLAASELKKSEAAKMPQQFPGLQNSIINGRAQIASEKEIEINARPVSE